MQENPKIIRAWSPPVKDNMGRTRRVLYQTPTGVHDQNVGLGGEIVPGIFEVISKPISNKPPQNSTS